MKPTILRDRFAQLVAEFGERLARAETLEQHQAVADRQRFQALIDGYRTADEQYRLRQVEVAEDFNLLDVMQLTGKEVRHSMVLAWLLDHDLHNLGTHAQGNLGFRLFLEELGLPAEYATCGHWVRREVIGDDSIVDVEVACRGKFIIHIENKIWSAEGTDQTNREWVDLQRRSAGLGVSREHVHAFFLTPHGTPARNPNFHAVSWRKVVRVLERFAEQAKPTDVKLFAAHYAKGLRRFIVVQDNKEVENAETTVE